MAGNDKTVMRDGAVVYLAGRNFIPHSDSPKWEIRGSDSNAVADEARADITRLTE